MEIVIFGDMEMTESKWVPWLDGIHIHDCYVVKDLQINIAQPGEQVDAPRHLILTGRNGSGKSSILRALDYRLEVVFGGELRIGVGKPIIPVSIEPPFSGRPNYLESSAYIKYSIGELSLAKPIGIHFEGELATHQRDFTYAFLPSERGIIKQLDRNLEQYQFDHLDFLSNTIGKVGVEFEKFLVSMKVASLFHKENGKVNAAERYDKFLARILSVFQDIFEDNSLRLQFHASSLSFFFIFDGERKVQVQDVSDGHFSFVLMILSLFARQEKIRGEDSENTADIPGLVLIDEPELHLHLDLQYQIMPLLTELFPKIQFIVATHSPAVISSIRNATVYDLSKREYAPSYIAGESFSSLMESHFGLENEFGPVADEFLGKMRHIYLNGGTKQEKSAAIRSVMEKYQDIITPTLRVELESTIIHLEAEKAR